MIFIFEERHGHLITQSCDEKTKVRHKYEQGMTFANGQIILLWKHLSKENY
jgi:hypothetical protein